MPDIDIRALILLIALILDAVFGDPPWLWARIPHPTTLMGALISALDHQLNRKNWSSNTRRICGLTSLAIIASVCGLAGWFLSKAFHFFPFWFALEAITVMIMIAQKSLYTHVADVATALKTEGLQSGRNAVARIVGRDPQALDEAAVSRAAIESLAENFSDGTVAPVFFYLLAGLPGLFIYKAINTADSMIGYKSDRHLAFGWAAARSDDILNLLPARLSAFLIMAGAALSLKKLGRSLEVTLRDAGKHASPNAGWPEAAMAGALNIALAGPRRYADKLTNYPWLNEEGRKTATPKDINNALSIFVYACALQLVLVASFAWLSL